LKLAGAEYAPGDSIDADVVAGLRNLDALLSNNYIRSATPPFTSTGKQARHVPVGIRAKVADADPLDAADVPVGSVEEILAWVNEDSDRAALALDAEEALPGDPRSALVIALEDIIAAPTEADVPDGTVQEVLDWVGFSVLRATVALAVENAAQTPRSTLVTALEAIIDPQAQ
jgi:hypothetical protein